MRCCLIGKTLKHSYSKPIHQSFGYEYDVVELEENKVQDFIKNSNYDRINVTIPYKSLIMPYLDYVSPKALEIGAVNTIIKSGGKIKGYNTDFYGMRYMINRSGIKIKNQTVMVLGTGGTSKTAVSVLKSLLAKEIIVVSRTGEVNYQNCYDYSPSVILNTTPVGMYPNQFDTPIDISKFRGVKGVLDVIYNPLKTKLLFDAEKLKIKTANGLGMLVAQAKYAKELFLGKEIKENLFDKEIEREIIKLENSVKNIVLIGMPGSGKSFVAKKLSGVLGLEVVDTDDLIEKRTGKTPKEIIESFGEEKFREIETEVIKELSLMRNVIISTGGGAVVKEQNEFLLKAVGNVVFVRRKLRFLDTTNRPLSSDKKKLKALKKARKKSYKQFSNYCVNNNKDINKTIKRILKNENFSA